MHLACSLSQKITQFVYPDSPAQKSLVKNINKIMTKKINNLVSSVALIAGLAVSPCVIASSSIDASKDLAGSTTQELPAKAAQLVAKASASEKQDVAAVVVKAAIELNPTSVVSIVSAMSRENPATAPVVAVNAVILQHKRIGMIAKAAAAAAPSEAAKIAAALIKEFPRDYGVIALAVSEGAPKSGREILAVVADYIPALQPYIQATLANFAATDGNVPIQAILSQSYNQALASGVVMATVAPNSSTRAGTYSQTSPSTSGGVTFSPPVLSGPVLGPPFTGNSNTMVTSYTTNSITNEGPTRYPNP
jgi:hypothetical protein